MAVSAALELPVGEAMAWFEAMPQDQRLRSLAPDFAQADTRRAPGLACVHVGFEQDGARWLHTLHLRPVPGFGWSAISPYGYGGPLCNSEDPRLHPPGLGRLPGLGARPRSAGEFCRFHPEARHQRFFLGEVRPNRATDQRGPAGCSGGNAVQHARAAQAQAHGRGAGALVAPCGRLAGLRCVLPPGHGNDGRARALPLQRRLLHRDRRAAKAWSCASAAGTPSGSPPACTCSSGDAGDASPGGTLEYHLGASSEAGHAIGSAYRLQHAAAQEGAARGLAQLYLGGGTTTDADNPLLFYKRAFSRRERTFHVGNAIHDEALYEAFARSRGYHRESAPINLLFD